MIWQFLFTWRYILYFALLIFAVILPLVFGHGWVVGKKRMLVFWSDDMAY